MHDIFNNAIKLIIISNLPELNFKQFGTHSYEITPYRPQGSFKTVNIYESVQRVR